MHKRVLIPYRHERKVKPYEEAARAGGVEPVPILKTGAVSLEGFAGLLLMGGTDVNPKRYGEAAHAETDRPDDERDEMELELIHEAIEKDLPIFAICRGLQILNVYHGGTLIQHVSSAERHARSGGGGGWPRRAGTIGPRRVASDVSGVRLLPGIIRGPEGVAP